MKPKMLILIIAVTLSAASFGGAEAQTVSASWPHYAVVKLGTLGGLSRNGCGGVTNNGWVSGDSSLPGDYTEHDFVWRDGVIMDLGTLGGANSSTAWPQKNTHGLIVGQA